MNEQGGHFDLIIIGAGIAGTHAALLAVSLNKKVALIEKNKLGGNSANYSDIPFGVLNQITKKIITISSNHNDSIQTGRVSHNFQKINQTINQAIDKTKVTSKGFYKSNKITVFEGNAYFLSENKISVNNIHLTADKFIIASGSNWSLPRIAGLSQVDFLTPNSIANLNRLPQSVYIVGGTETAVYLAQTLSILGVKVYLTLKTKSILPNYDQEINELVEKYLRNNFDITISTNSKTLEVSQQNRTIKVLFSHAGIERKVNVDKIILAEKLLPETDLGLNNTKVDYDQNGIIANDFLQTTNSNIFAAGNVLGHNYDAQISVLEAETAFYNIFHKKPKAINYQIFPKLIKLHPNVAKVGLNQKDCQKLKIKHQATVVKFNQLPYSILGQHNQIGLLKMITNKNNQIIGAEVFGDEAEGIIHQLAMAIKLKQTPNQLLETPAAFLSCYEIINIASNEFINK